MGKMESSQYQYLKLNKYLLCCVGQWPYQTPLEKLLIGIVFLPIAVGQATFQVQRSESFHFYLIEERSYFHSI